MEFAVPFHGTIVRHECAFATISSGGPTAAPIEWEKKLVTKLHFPVAADDILESLPVLSIAWEPGTFVDI